MNNKVFISGSISVKSLNKLLLESFNKILLNNLEVLVGDAPGIDTLVQDFFNRSNYTNLTVYSIQSFPRYKANDNFQTKYIEVSNEVKKERERQTFKDEAMSSEANYSLVIWDGKSKGSYANIIRALKLKRAIKVYYTIKNNFLDKKDITIQNIDFIYRENNGYSATEVIEYLKEQGIEEFKRTQDLNKYLLEKNVNKKEEKIYLPLVNYDNLFLIEKYKGKISGLKFKSEFIAWLKKELSGTVYKQGELF
jgi:hypothetical protein